MTISVNKIGNNNFLKTQLLNSATPRTVAQNAQTLETTQNNQTVDNAQLLNKTQSSENAKTKGELKVKKESELISAVKEYINAKQKEGKGKATFSGKDEYDLTINIDDIKKGLDIYKIAKKAYDWYKNPAKEAGKELAKKITNSLTEKQEKSGTNNNDKTIKKTPDQDANTNNKSAQKQKTNNNKPAEQQKTHTKKTEINPKDNLNQSTVVLNPAPKNKFLNRTTKTVENVTMSKVDQVVGGIKLIKGLLKGDKKAQEEGANQMQRGLNRTVLGRAATQKAHRIIRIADKFIGKPTQQRSGSVVPIDGAGPVFQIDSSGRPVRVANYGKVVPIDCAGPVFRIDSSGRPVRVANYGKVKPADASLKVITPKRPK